MAKNEKTSKRVATQASKQLSNSKSTKPQKSVAASALTQAPDKNGLGKSSLSKDFHAYHGLKRIGHFSWPWKGFSLGSKVNAL